MRAEIAPPAALPPVTNAAAAATALGLVTSKAAPSGISARRASNTSPATGTNSRQGALRQSYPGNSAAVAAKSSAGRVMISARLPGGDIPEV